MKYNSMLYKVLKTCGLNKKIKHTKLYYNKNTGDKGWEFVLSDNKVYRYILGKGVYIKTLEGLFKEIEDKKTKKL